jgi:hypothetical protein
MDFISPNDAPAFDPELLEARIKSGEVKVVETVSVSVGKDNNGLMISEIRDADTGEVIGEVGVFDGTE